MILPLTEERTQQLVDTLKATEVANNEARQDDLRQRVRLWRPELEKYRECNNHAANSIALQPGDPLLLATAARAMCSHYGIQLQSALVAAYADIPGVGEQVLQHARQTTLESTSPRSLVLARWLNLTSSTASMRRARRRIHKACNKQFEVVVRKRYSNLMLLPQQYSSAPRIRL
ncbi:MAG: hypothetical protein WAK55_17785 [Xanthobacteraceae bacterium]